MRLTDKEALVAIQILVLCGLLILSGCASTKPLRKDVQIQAQSGAGVIIQSATVRDTKAGVMISGSVRRALGYGPSSRSHLDIEVMALDGSMQMQAATRYFPSPIPHSRRFRRHAHYAVELPLMPSVGSIIRVSHHATRIQQCPYRD